jgi:hypothetical protein
LRGYIHHPASRLASLAATFSYSTTKVIQSVVDTQELLAAEVALALDLTALVSKLAKRGIVLPGELFDLGGVLTGELVDLGGVLKVELAHVATMLFLWNVALLEVGRETVPRRLLGTKLGDADEEDHEEECQLEVSGAAGLDQRVSD